MVPATLIALAMMANASVDARAQAGSEEALGTAAVEHRSYSEAAQHYARALELAEQTRDASLIAHIFEDLEDAYFTIGKFDRVLELANRMLEKPGDPNAPFYLHQRGMAYSEMHEPEAAWRSYEQALPLAEATGDLKLIGDIHRDRAIWLFRYQRDQRAALKEFDQALDYGRRAHAWYLVTSTLHTSGNMFRFFGDLPEALRRYQEALSIAVREHTGTAHILKNIGATYRQMGMPKESAEVLTRAITTADQRDVNEICWQARNELGILMRDNDPVRAEQCFREALDLLEAHQSDVLLEDFRPGALAGAMLWSNPYDEYITLLLQQRRPADAFFVAERERARAFLETLSASHEAIRGEVPAAFVTAERQILDRIKTAQALLRTDEVRNEKRKALVTAIGHSEAELTALRLKFAVEHPAVGHARFPKLWQIPELQSTLLAPDEALIAFHLGKSESVAWIVTRDRLRTVILPPAASVEKLAEDALRELRNPLSSRHIALDALSRALQIDSLASLAGITRLTIVPDGILHDIPIDALVDSRALPLIERFAVSYAPSASSLAYLRSAQRRAAHDPVTLLAVANPVVSATALSSTRQADLAHLNLLAPLPQSAGEAERITALFGSTAHVLEGSRARISELRSEGLERARMIHFATHGLVDEVRPDRSGLVLTADPPRDDGLLQVRDVYSLHLNADLVTLSACETALGQNVTGEGMIGLTRAFFFAGARSVVASLWDVDDASTSRLMQEFYANIRRGDPIDIALQRAKLDLLHTGKAPFYWASFIVSGNARISEPPPANPNPAPEIGVAVAFLAAALLYLRIVKVRRGEDTSGRP